jgi:hypothetical protein
MAKAQLHELPKIIKLHYCDVHKTDLGNPVSFFARFDERIRAHPTQPVFSLNGIESWPSTIVAPNATRDNSIQPIQHAWTDVRNLSIAEQNLNMTTLTAYQDSLQWIIDNKQWLSEKEPGILRWFEERVHYDSMEEETPVRRSPRGKKRKSAVSSSSSSKQKTVPE